jgi:hypothetical protein
MIIFNDGEGDDSQWCFQLTIRFKRDQTLEAFSERLTDGELNILNFQISANFPIHLRPG